MVHLLLAGHPVLVTLLRGSKAQVTELLRVRPQHSPACASAGAVLRKEEAWVLWAVVSTPRQAAGADTLFHQSSSVLWKIGSTLEKHTGLTLPYLNCKGSRYFAHSNENNLLCPKPLDRHFSGDSKKPSSTPKVQPQHGLESLRPLSTA